MPERFDYCRGCPNKRLYAQERRQSTAPGCEGRVRVLPGIVLTAIDGRKVVRPAGDAKHICGREWPGITPEEGETIVRVPGSPNGVDIVVIKGEGADFLEGADDVEKRRVVADYMEEVYAFPDPGAPVPDDAPRRRHLAVVSGGRDVGNIKARVGAVIEDDYLSRLETAVDAATQAQQIVIGELHSSQNPAAATIVALAARVQMELEQAASYERQLRDEGNAYVGEI